MNHPDLQAGVIHDAIKSLLLSRSRTNSVVDFGNRSDGETTFFGMLSEQVFVVGFVHTKHFVARYITLYPLNAGPHFFEHCARFLRDGFQIAGGKITSTGNVSFNEVGFHGGFFFVGFGCGLCLCVEAAAEQQQHGEKAGNGCHNIFFFEV